MTQAVRETDRRLAAISERFDLLLHVSPVNAAAAAQSFRAGGHQRTPEFLYHPRPMDPGLLKRELFKIPLERIEDPTLAHIFSEKRDELDRQITLVADRNTPRFLLGSRQIYGDPTPGLLSLAHRLLHDTPPQQVRPETLISRNRDVIKSFIAARDDLAVLKPLSGSGGRNVFLAQPADKPNLNQMIEAVKREGYVIAQEYLPDAVHGDTRLFLMDGKPLRHKGRYAALRRVRAKGDPDMRSNMAAGATSIPAQVTDSMLELAEMVRPRLVEDGMFLVGLDIVGDKIMEINVFSPGGLNSAEKFEERDFSREIIQALEQKVAQSPGRSRTLDRDAPTSP